MSEDSEHRPGRGSPTLAPPSVIERGPDTDGIQTHPAAGATGDRVRVRCAGPGTECENVVLE